MFFLIPKIKVKVRFCVGISTRGLYGLPTVKLHLYVTTKVIIKQGTLPTTLILQLSNSTCGCVPNRDDALCPRKKWTKMFIIIHSRQK